MTRERIAEPKRKKATPIPVRKTPVAEGGKQARGANLRGNHPDHLRRDVGITL
jgi:hypothetical protein